MALTKPPVDDGSPPVNPPRAIHGTDASFTRYIFRPGPHNIGRNAPVIVFKDEVLQGETKVDAEKLRMLGTDYETLDQAWEEFVGELNRPAPPSLERPLHRPHDPWEDWKVDHQDDGWWRIEIDVTQGQFKSVNDLPFIEDKHINRTVTYHATQWGPGQVTDQGSVPPTTSTPKEKTEPLPPSAGLSALWLGVSEDDIKASDNARRALHDAAAHLQDALDEIHIAWRVAKTHWLGPRSEATRFRFELESEIISSLRTIAAGWERYMGDLVGKQREGKRKDDELKHALEAEVAVELIALTPWGRVGRAFRVVFSAARGSKVVQLSTKLRWAFNAAARLGSDLHRVLANHARWLRGQGAIRAFALRAEVESMKELAKVSATNVSNGKSPLAGDDPWNIFVASGLAGTAGFQGIGAIARKYGVTNAVARYGGDDAADAAAKTAAKSATEAALAAPFVSGVSTAVAKPAAKRAIMKYVAKLEKDGKPLTPEQIAKIEAQVDNALGVAQKAGEKAGEEVPKRVGEEQDLPSPPPGEFPQRPGN